MVVGSDGKVMLCSMDEEGDHIVGDANLQTIYEIWHGEKMSKAREMHSKKMDLKISRYVKDVVYPEKWNKTKLQK